MKNLWRLLRYIKPYKKAAILSPLFILGEVLMDLLIPTLIRTMIDVGVANGDMQYIAVRGLWMMGAALVGMVTGLLSNYYSAVVSQSVGTDIRSALFGRIQTLSYGDIDQFESGQLITRGTNDINQVQSMIQMGLKMVVRAPFLLVGALFMAIVTSPQLAGIVLLMIPALTLGIILVMKVAFPLFTMVQERIDRVNTVIGENLSGIRVIKAFVRKDYEKERFGRSNKDLYDVSIKAFGTIAGMMPIIMLVANGGIVAAIWMGGLGYGAGTLQIGQIQAFINYLSLIIFSLMIMAMTLVMISRSEASAQRINEVLELQSSLSFQNETSEERRLTGQVRFKAVSFHYDGKEEDSVLNEISFETRPGESVAILGPTGSGKSSLVSLIPRFYEVKGGTIQLDGRDLREYPEAVLRRNISIAQQQVVLFSGTIAENIRFGKPDAPMEEVEAAARAAQAHEFIAEMKKGYETQLGQRGVNLSGGQKQRIAIARALLTRPAILILDDSTSAVDTDTERRIQQSLSSYLKGSTLFVIAQRITSVMGADHILVLEEGRLEAQGTHRELMISSPLYRSIYDSQLGGD